MIDLTNSELILTLTSVTPRDNRERIETREQRLLSRRAIELFTKLTNEGLSDAEMGTLMQAVYTDVHVMLKRVAQTIESGMSKTEWEAAGRPDWKVP